jgi:hypothetical protein
MPCVFEEEIGAEGHLAPHRAAQQSMQRQARRLGLKVQQSDLEGRKAVGQQARRLRARRQFRPGLGGGQLGQFFPDDAFQPVEIMDLQPHQRAGAMAVSAASTGASP